MKNASAKFLRKKELAIANLLQTPKIAEAAKATGIGEATLLRWLKEGDFRELYRQAQRLAVNAAIGRLQYATSEAAQVLVCVMNDETAGASARVTAAKAVIEMGFRGVELQDLEGRILVLEDMTYDG